MTFGEKVVKFHQHLFYTGEPLPVGINVINPFSGSPVALGNIALFAEKFLKDDCPRHIILGINPGRFGAGITGIPFTDTKRLISECGISYNGKPTHEISSVFIYDMIHAFGGTELFYKRFYINSPFPLAITRTDKNGSQKNYNYYDDAVLLRSTTSFMVSSIRRLIDLGIHTDVCFCLGTGKNAKFLNKINEEFGFFQRIIPLEHPRFIMQYKNADKERYIDKYLDAFKQAL
jgi:hypothetical protein